MNLAAIKEFQVISNTYSPEFGRGYGAVVLVQTKGGTNQVRGELFYYRLDSQWNALSAFQTTLPDNQRPSYGGVVGFPILKDKLFGFASYEHGHRSGQGTYVRDIFIPSDFSAPRLSRGNDTPDNRAWQDSVLARFGDLTRLRHDFPLVLVAGQADETAIRSLSEIVNNILQAVAPRGIEGEATRRHVLRLERELRTLVANGESGPLSRLWDLAAKQIGAQDDSALGDSLGRARAALPVDGEVVDCTHGLPSDAGPPPASGAAVASGRLSAPPSGGSRL